MDAPANKITDAPEAAPRSVAVPGSSQSKPGTTAIKTPASSPSTRPLTGTKTTPNGATSSATPYPTPTGKLAPTRSNDSIVGPISLADIPVPPTGINPFTGTNNIAPLATFNLSSVPLRRPLPAPQEPLPLNEQKDILMYEKNLAEHQRQQMLQQLGQLPPSLQLQYQLVVQQLELEYQQRWMAGNYEYIGISEMRELGLLPPLPQQPQVPQQQPLPNPHSQEQQQQKQPSQPGQAAQAAQPVQQTQQDVHDQQRMLHQFDQLQPLLELSQRGQPLQPAQEQQMQELLRQLPQLQKQQASSASVSLPGAAQPQSAQTQPQASSSSTFSSIPSTTLQQGQPLPSAVLHHPFLLSSITHPTSVHHLAPGGINPFRDSFQDLLGLPEQVHQPYALHHHNLPYNLPYNYQSHLNKEDEEFAFLQRDEAQTRKELHQLFYGNDEPPPKQFVSMREVQKRPLTVDEYEYEEQIQKKRRLESMREEAYGGRDGGGRGGGGTTSGRSAVSSASTWPQVQTGGAAMGSMRSSSGTGVPEARTTTTGIPPPGDTNPMIFARMRPTATSWARAADDAAKKASITVGYSTVQGSDGSDSAKRKADPGKKESTGTTASLGTGTETSTQRGKQDQ